mmetsp:Transcript_23772/g.36453  ORF Transcript_23772/g.36453 Transcript_23772/m.36453 type:complete len:88 (+) Transcript_23772:737-1000(+)
MSLVCFTEILHTSWLIYGNFLYYRQNDNKAFQECRTKNNPTYLLVMLMLLIMGYIYFVVYFLFITLVAGLFLRRFVNRRHSRREQTS